jgi:hypothetical protein
MLIDVIPGGGRTVTLATADRPSTVAVMVVLPTATAVATPVALIVTTAALAELHVTGRPVSDVPSAARAEALKACVPPGSSVAVAGVICTLATATGGRTVMPAVALFP